jgi:hypothetical protein
VWHTSVSGFGLSDDTLRAKALRVLEGVGDSRLGQWEERGPKAFHIRRRMTDEEAKRVGGVSDIRGTNEATKRFERMRPYLPLGWTAIE